MVRIGILASGNGSNAQRLVEHFTGHPHAEVVLIGSDRPQAHVVQRAWDMGVPLYLFNGALLRTGAVLRELQGQQVDLLVLAGFLRLIPAELVKAFPERIINLHPALLPKFGGRGMFGQHVHQAVLAAGEKESGITIHYVDERYDEGEHIAQFRCPVLPGDTATTLAERIHDLEHAHFPQVVEEIVRRSSAVVG
ncbi:MAG TPA: phosphoribosylglycinamide formyltransferase [Flavobacteriales bacterium]|nr:phosphoribosylglycinamide formyltransferase [Flavobacteriales bacterium]HNU57772.1 phosphoribosylglycinamide formyltransferase [Flavobacteriales bacterium]